jgi:hypothetical protein
VRPYPTIRLEKNAAGIVARRSKFAIARRRAVAQSRDRGACRELDGRPMGLDA